MKGREFAYWLMGFFELSGPNGGPLTADQRRVVKNHLNLVKAVEGKLDSFGNYVEGWLDVAKIAAGNAGIEATATEQLRERLRAHFRDEIDPSYGPDRERLQRIHDGLEEPNPVKPVSVPIEPPPPPPRRQGGFGGGGFGGSGRIMCEDKSQQPGVKPDPRLERPGSDLEVMC